MGGLLSSNDKNENEYIPPFRHSQYQFPTRTSQFEYPFYDTQFVPETRAAVYDVLPETAKQDIYDLVMNPEIEPSLNAYNKHMNTLEKIKEKLTQGYIKFSSDVQRDFNRSDARNMSIRLVNIVHKPLEDLADLNKTIKNDPNLLPVTRKKLNDNIFNLRSHIRRYKDKAGEDVERYVSDLNLERNKYGLNNLDVDDRYGNYELYKPNEDRDRDFLTLMLTNK